MHALGACEHATHARMKPPDKTTLAGPDPLLAADAPAVSIITDDTNAECIDR